MKHTVTVSLKKENLDAVFMREILLSGSCEAILPMNLYRGKKYCFGVYHTEGFRCLGPVSYTHLTLPTTIRV